MVRPQLLRQSEDCLYLNIFVPVSETLESSQGKPVSKVFIQFLEAPARALYFNFFCLCPYLAATQSPIHRATNANL